jgi:hypothetical protein
MPNKVKQETLAALESNQAELRRNIEASKELIAERTGCSIAIARSTRRRVRKSEADQHEITAGVSGPVEKDAPHRWGASFFRLAQARAAAGWASGCSICHADAAPIALRI